MIVSPFALVAHECVAGIQFAGIAIAVRAARVVAFAETIGRIAVAVVRRGSATELADLIEVTRPRLALPPVVVVVVLVRRSATIATTAAVEPGAVRIAGQVRPIFVLARNRNIFGSLE